ncbi:ATP-binding protein [Micromonospora sp. NPDC003197]
MSIEMRWLVETNEAYSLVRFFGALDLPLAHEVRGALLTCIADRPTTVLVDLAQLRADDPEAMAVLLSTGCEVAEWPTGEVLFRASGTEHLPASAERKGPFLSLSALKGALPNAKPAVGTAADSIDVDLDPAPGAARQARELVAEGCRRWALPELAASARVAVTELVSNVVTHARTPMTLRMARRAKALHVAVRDYSPKRPTFAGPVPSTSIGGRGLLLIDNMATRWGTSLLENGKLVWAVLTAEDEPVEGRLRTQTWGSDLTCAMTTT